MKSTSGLDLVLAPPSCFARTAGLQNYSVSENRSIRMDCPRCGDNPASRPSQWQWGLPRRAELPVSTQLSRVSVVGIAVVSEDASSVVSSEDVTRFNSSDDNLKNTTKFYGGTPIKSASGFHFVSLRMNLSADSRLSQPRPWRFVRPPWHCNG